MNKMEKLFVFLKTANEHIHFTTNHDGLFNYQSGHLLSYPEWLVLYPKEKYILSRLLEEFEIDLEKI